MINDQALNINAVSGTIVKTYKKSFILSFHKDSQYWNTILDETPHIRHGYDNIYVVVLQIMPCGNNEYIAEIMWKKDFDKMFEQQAESEVQK